MKRKIYTTPDGVRMEGTLDRVYVIAFAQGPNEDGEPAYSGDSRVSWDGQETVTGDDGERIWVCEDGCEWHESELLIVEVDE